MAKSNPFERDGDAEQDPSSVTGAGEEQPLIQDRGTSFYEAIDVPQDRHGDFDIPKRMRNKYRLQLYVISLIITFIGCFCIMNLVIMIPRAEEFVNQSVEMDIQNVELKSITTKGINLRVEGLNVMDYSGIENAYFQNLFKVGGGIFNTATIDLNTVNLTTTVDEKLLNIGTVDIPHFDLNLKNGQTTNLDLVVTVLPNTKEILGLIKSLLSNPDQIFKVQGLSTVKIHLGSIPIGNFKINFQQDVIGSKYVYFNDRDFKLKNLTLSDNDEKGYNISFVVNAPNPIKYKLFGFELPSLDWEILIKDCLDKHSINLVDGSITSEKFKLSPLDKEINIHLQSSIDHLSPRLTEKCSFDNDGTPISFLIDEFVNNKSLPILVKNSKGSKEFPAFINEFLKAFEFNIDYLSNFETSKLIHNVSLDNLNFQFQNGDTNKPVINGDINIFVKPPFQIKSFGINKIKGVPSLYHQGLEFGKINLNEWHDCTNLMMDDLLYIRFTLNQEELQITNKRLFGQVINEVIGKGSSRVYIDAVLDCLIGTLLGEFEIDKIHASSESDITRRFLLEGFGLV